MKMDFLKSRSLAFLTMIWLVAETFAAESTPNLSKAKQQADAKGYTFITNHDEIVAKAKKEGKLRVTAAMDAANIKIYGAAFQKKYPFIDIDGRESNGPDVAQRILREIQSGAAKDWDTILVYAEYRSEYTPHLWNVDLLGMANHGVLQIPPAMIDQNMEMSFHPIPISKSRLTIQNWFPPTCYQRLGKTSLGRN